MNGEDKKQDIKRLIADGTKPARKRAQPKRTMQIVGDGNIMAGRDVIHTDHVEYRTTVEYQPGATHITPTQRQRLKELVADIVAAEAVRKVPRGFGAVWGAFQRRFKVPKYELLPGSATKASLNGSRRTWDPASAARRSLY